jgi:hypothetical protein
VITGGQIDRQFQTGKYQQGVLIRVSVLRITQRRCHLGDVGFPGKVIDLSAQFRIAARLFEQLLPTEVRVLALDGQLGVGARVSGPLTRPEDLDVDISPFATRNSVTLTTRILRWRREQ